MGFALSWIACQAEFNKSEIAQLQQKFDADRKAAALQMAAMIARMPMLKGKFPMFEGGPVYEQKLPSGWWLMTFERSDIIQSGDSLLRALSKSKGKDIIACAVEEHVMVSRIACFRNGQRIWHFMHELDKGKYNLQMDGTPPPQFNAVAAKYRNLQNTKDDCDYIFDIPVALGKAIVGYRHDEG